MRRSCNQKTLNLHVILNGAELREESRRLQKRDSSLRSERQRIVFRLLFGRRYPKRVTIFRGVFTTGRMAARNEAPAGPCGDGRREERSFSGGYFAAETGFQKSGKEVLDRQAKQPGVL